MARLQTQKTLAGVDATRLDQVIDTYARIQQEVGHPAPTFALRRYLVKHGGHRADDGRAHELLRAVIDEYGSASTDPKDDDLRELAAEAEGLLGDYEARRTNDMTELSAALDYLEQAAELTIFPQRKWHSRSRRRRSLLKRVSLNSRVRISDKPRR